MGGALLAAERHLRAVDGGGRGAVLQPRRGHHPGIVAHAGLAVQRPGGAPDVSSLAEALRLGVDAIEVDACATADGQLVLRHDAKLADGTAVAALTRNRLERRCGEVLTLDDAVNLAAWRTPVIIDVKSPACLAPLSRWLNANQRARVAVCTDNVPMLGELHANSPRAALLQTFPRVGSEPFERVVRVLSGLAAHRGVDVVRTIGDLTTAVGSAMRSPRFSLQRFSGLPWRHRLPASLHAVRQRIGAIGITVHHSVVTPQLCATAHMLDLRVVAWTVNDPATARRVADCGVDLITTDDVVAVRQALVMPAAG